MDITDLNKIMRLIDLLAILGLYDDADVADMKNKLVDRVMESMR